ncbi:MULTISPECIES: very short patch repair endonuclease [Tetragenococcus]|uniref:very short patch repair endonuclease n=1 Tax=Tetragenococcus TaxID=51668 RepID=UPI00083DF707|nr:MULTISPECIES: very short patch repair endonuclease [Tetragenococcus]AOF48284.1 endonuclease [Tetragenococcus halophilus]AYW46491.1 very short patch repair endonuclease [Tetragenococcus koreensis]MCF1678192.1 very short patch repair endonuclease [Tetragenococcus koreensis]MCO8292235.1 very short patch repair endonuclease [Tetragenococcus halophilus]GEN91794.1 very short patch repair endonuclease [Tetragenococcus koreensis]
MTKKMKTTAYRSQMMSKIKSTGGKAEVLLRKKLWHHGIRYRKNYKRLPGKPDIAITKYKIAVFVDGEFWHGYDWRTKKERIKSNREYWISKIEKNIARDKYQNEELRKLGWTVLRFWESHEVLKKTDDCVKKILKTVDEKNNMN